MASVFADTKIFNYWRVRIQLENKLVDIYKVLLMNKEVFQLI